MIEEYGAAEGSEWAKLAVTFFKDMALKKRGAQDDAHDEDDDRTSG